MPLEISKRDGSIVPFDRQKIETAIEKCFAAIGVDAEASSIADMVERAVDKYASVSVEQVQNVVETMLCAVGLRHAARAYMAYRDERAQLRAARTVDEETRRAFAESAAILGGDPIRMFQLLDKYARHTNGRRETWPECVDRGVEFLREIVVANCGGDRLTAGEWAEIHDAVRAMDALPSMRLLSQAGASARRDNVAIYNCAYQAFDDLSCVYESLHIAMAGCGDAYSVESKFIRKLPFVRYQREGAKPDLFVVPDTSEGWVAALRFGVERWFDGHDVEYDFSELRPAGTVLRTKGGQASGPGPLRYVLDGVRRVILSRQGGSIRPIDGNDIMCITGEAGNSGGQRRTAKLSLSDWGDTEMRDAKGPDFFGTTPWRSNANNSAAWPDEGPSMVDLLDQMTTMFRHKSGERGIFSRSAALRTMPAERAAFLVARGAADSIGTNPCGEIVLQSRQFCNLSQAVARPGDDVASLRRKVRVATILGTIQSLATHFPHLRPEWAENCRSERLLGVDITGQMDCPAVRDAGVLRELRDVARATNAAFAARFGIRQSAAITCDKPNGNSSLLINAAPGIGARKMRYGIRNARVAANSPVYRVLRACNVPMDPENGQTVESATRWVVHFPYRAPEGAIVAKEQTAIAQLEYWKLCKLNWTEHNPSVTIEYSPDEMIEIIGWLWENRSIVGGLSFLPKSDSIYRQLPYEETTREEYERAAAAFPSIDWSLIAAFEAHDQTTSAQELACGAGGCDVDFAALAASAAKLEAAGL